MEIGKVPNDILNKIIINKIRNNRPEILLRPKIGEDCCAVDFGEYACVLSTDPITGAVNEVGRLAVHISCNDIASSGVEPLGLMVTILAPAGTTEQELDMLMGQICETANSLNVDIIGGHTEITAAVNRCVISSVALGKVLKNKLVSTSGAKPGDSIILTKTAGIEGTAIIAYDREEELAENFGIAFTEKAKAFMEQISVVKEGVVAGEFGVSAMHDVTEGGVLGALWEIASASGVGITVYKDKIPVRDETLKIAELYGIDPLKLISSGCMAITCRDGEMLVKELQKSGIKAAIVGEVTEDLARQLVINGVVEEIKQPDSDELYKVIK